MAESGAGGDPPVLLMHGWGASIYMWRAWFAPLAAAGRRAIAIDLPGHGLSDKPAEPEHYRLASMVGAVREFLAIERLADVDIVAQSMAGTITVELALMPGSPVRRAVLVNPACFGRVRMQGLAKLVSGHPIADAILPRLVARWLVARTHRMVYGDPSRLTERDEDEYWAPSQFPAFARSMRKLLHEFQWTRSPVIEMAARLGALRGRMLVVLGTRDVLVRDSSPYVAQLRATGAPVDVLEIDGGGHAINEERPDVVVPAVLEFLAHGDPLDQ
ncbi:MAG: alpha/beta hydrolase [bacterium]